MGEVVKTKLPCKDVEGCGSSDAMAQYDDGSFYCFSCRLPFPADGEDYTARATVSSKAEGFVPLQGECVTLTKRGLSLATTKRYNYRACGNEQVSDYYWKGKLVAQHIRTAAKDFFWVGKPQHVELYGQHLWKSGGKKLVITEGELDCLTIAQLNGLKWPVVSVPSGAASAKKYVAMNMEFVQSFSEVVIAFDNDEAGRDASIEVARCLPQGKAYVVQWDADKKDASDYLQAFVKGESNAVRNMSDRLWQPSRYQPSGIVTLGALRERYVNRPPVEKVPFPYKGLDRRLGGNQRKRLYLYTAGEGVGKSSTVQDIGRSVRKADARRLGVMALEEDVLETVDRHVASELLVPPALLPNLPLAKRLAVFDEMVEKKELVLYDHFGSQQSDTIVAAIRYLVEVEECTDILLDHISIVISGQEEAENISERQLIDKLMTEMRSLIEQTNCTIHAIVHLRKPSQGLSWNQGRVPTLTELRGSGSLGQLSDAVIALARNVEAEDVTEQNTTRIYVLKNRPNGLLGGTGLCDELLMNRTTGQLEPLDEFADFDETPSAKQEPQKQNEDF